MVFTCLLFDCLSTNICQTHISLNKFTYDISEMYENTFTTITHSSPYVKCKKFGIYLIVKVVRVVGNKDVDVPHDLKHIQTLCQTYHTLVNLI